MDYIDPGRMCGGTDGTLTPIQQADADVVWEANRGYKDTENNIFRVINEKLSLAVPNTCISNVMVNVGQGQNYPQMRIPTQYSTRSASDTAILFQTRR